MRSVPSVMTRVFVALAAAAVLFGCSRIAEPSVSSLMLRRNSVAYKAGSMFVSVHTTGEWRLSVEYEDDDAGGCPCPHSGKDLVIYF